MFTPVLTIRHAIHIPPRSSQRRRLPVKMPVRKPMAILEWQVTTTHPGSEQPGAGEHQRRRAGCRWAWQYRMQSLLRPCSAAARVRRCVADFWPAGLGQLSQAAPFGGVGHAADSGPEAAMARSKRTSRSSCDASGTGPAWYHASCRSRSWCWRERDSSSL